MKKITIEINNQNISFTFSSSKTEDTILDSQNIETLNKITCSYKYILKNTGLVTTFITNRAEKLKPTKMIVEKYSLTGLIIKLTTNTDNIDTIIFEEKNNLSEGVYELILDNKLKIKNLECYNIDKNQLKTLKEKGIKITLKNEITFASKFMRENNFNTHADLYGKTSITFNNEIDTYDIEDFQNFLDINKCLNTIDIKKYNQNNLKNILQILNKNQRKNITINIYENNSDVIKDFSQIKKINKKYKKNIKIKIIYSKSYKQKNRKKQILLNILTLILISTIITVIGYFIYTLLNQKQSEKLSKNIQEYKNEILTKQETKEEKQQTTNIYNKNFSKVISELKNINEETVGWLTVNNTNIDYPVVKHNNNDFYLNHDFEKKYNIYGWVFMDYRNSTQNLNQNTIIYGHDSANVTFGTLHKVLNKNWYTNKKNQIITFNTENEEAKWQIFSIYKIKETNDYLTTEFEDINEYNNFIKLLVNRSIYNFKTPVFANDKILTLSTCYGDTERLIIHAKKLS